MTLPDGRKIHVVVKILQDAINDRKKRITNKTYVLEPNNQTTYEKLLAIKKAEEEINVLEAYLKKIKENVS